MPVQASRYVKNLILCVPPTYLPTQYSRPAPPCQCALSCPAPPSGADRHASCGCRPATTAELQSYFAQHKVETNLNEWLNELVIKRPSAPYAWLATRMREKAPSDPTGTMPLLDKAVAERVLGAPLMKAWTAAAAFCGTAPAAATPATTAAAPATSARAAPQATGISLSIESTGRQSVILSIRKI